MISAIATVPYKNTFSSILGGFLSFTCKSRYLIYIVITISWNPEEKFGGSSLKQKDGGGNSDVSVRLRKMVCSLITADPSM